MQEQEGSGTRDDPERQAHTVLLETHWHEVFNRYDLNGDGMISLPELCAAIKDDRNINNIPEEAVRQIMVKSDDDHNGYLSYDEFVKMIQHPDNQGIFGHLNTLIDSYVRLAIPRSKTLSQAERDRGTYERAYSCWPPALGMIIISIIEVSIFAYDAAGGDTMAKGPAATVLRYDPYRRYEVWRYVTYMFVHAGSMHLVMNLIVQIMLGIPLEMVHRCWRVGVVYLAGVLAGSLGTSISTPSVFLVGASGGVYALIAAHVATIIMNWKEMQYAVYQLLIFLIWTIVDVRTAVHNHYVNPDSKVGYSSHLFGAVAGLFVSIIVLRNLDVLRWERVLWWASVSLYAFLMLACITWNLAVPSYFLPPKH